MSRLTVWAVEGMGEIRPGDQLGELVADACAGPPNGPLEDGDVLVVTQKVVSKAEGRLVAVDPDDPLGHKGLVEEEAARVLRRRGDLVITETRHGFVCASAGVDASNAKGPGTLVLLPVDPDASAARLRGAILEQAGVDVAVIVSDSFGRAWRQGTTDVALGVAGVEALRDLRGQHDSVGYELHTTQIAVADELAGAAELVMGKTGGVPAAIVRGVRAEGKGSGRDLLMPRERDLFR
jgi:coenzyme F420-0:L-glutamate ligase/coenzyme F420-1:gamma-L-glutamate ligase